MRSDRKIRNAALYVLVACLVCTGCDAAAQQAAGEPTELQQLRSELKRIELRIDALEAAQPATPKASLTAVVKPEWGPTEPESKAATGPEAVKEAEDKGMDTMDAGMGGETIKIPIIPALKIRGFGDVRFLAANQNLAVIHNTPGSPLLSSQAGRDTFSLGLMDLFITSKISEHFSYLTEIGFEADQATNGIGVDLERAQISYMPSDKFSMNIGRSHAMLGYYNTAFHHGTWFQTTIDRPRMFQFEDSGGPLPIHNIGVEAMGKIPGDKLGLHWFAEVGNGKQTYTLQSTVTPAIVLADHTGKSTNVGMYLRPSAISGLQAGFNWYQASLVPILSQLPSYGTPVYPFPNARGYYRQNIFIAHAVYITPSIELMVEDAEIRDVGRGTTQALYTSGGYAQVSRAFGEYRPYVRYQWLNPNFHDPNNAWVGRWVGPDVGVRWDMNPFIALKTEFSHYDWKNFSQDANGNQQLPILHKTINQLGMQITYTF